MWKGDTWYQVMMRLFVLTVQCRTRANRIGKHHMLNSIVESYLALHPGDKDCFHLLVLRHVMYFHTEKRRKADELNALDTQNRIIHDMVC